MASRYWLPASGTATVSPTFSPEWLHANTLRRPMTSPKGSTALSSTAASYNPDAADHLVSGDSLAIQYISEPIGPQTLAAQTIKLAVQVREVNTANNLFLAWKLWIWKADNTVGPTLVSLRRQGGAELTTTNTVRFDSVTSTVASVGNGDRIVLELGYGGLPIAAAGNGRHNGGFRLGESGTSDCLEVDGGSGITENPWLEFANDIVPYGAAPATSGVILAYARVRQEQAATRATSALARLSVAARISLTAVVPPKLTVGAVSARVAALVAVTVAPRTSTAGVNVRSTAHLATSGSRETSGSAAALSTPLLHLQAAPRTAYAVALLRAHTLTELVALSEFVYYWPPAERLKPVNLGYAYRGDTLILPVWQAVDQRGNLIDLTGSEVWFTAKADLADTDVDPVTIQCSTLAGGVVIIDPLLGSYQVTVPSDETQQLDDDTRFIFDVQIETSAANIHTVRRGVLAVIRDITRTPA